MKAEQERVSNLLTDTVTLLCRNGLQYKTEMKVQGLLGITLDDEVFLVHIDKKFGDLIGGELMSLQAGEEEAEGTCSGDNDSDGRQSPTSKKRQKARRKRRKSNSGASTSDTEIPSEKKIREEAVIVKTEPQVDDDLVLLEESDSKAGLHDKDTMRESYGLASHRLSQVTVDNSFLNNVNDDSSQVAEQLPGCSGWEDPLAVLSEHNNSGMPPGGSSSGGDDTMDQQTMSTECMTDRWQVGGFSGWTKDTQQCHSMTNFFGPFKDQYNAKAQRKISASSQETAENNNKVNQSLQEFPGEVCSPSRRQKRPVSSAGMPAFCGYPGCNKMYSNHRNLLRHQTTSHGRQQYQQGLYGQNPAQESTHDLASSKMDL